MKLGDKLICKETFDFEEGVMYYKNKMYYISSYDSDEEFVIKGELETMSGVFSIKKSKFMIYLYDYFYSPEQIRKMKLNSI